MVEDGRLGTTIRICAYLIYRPHQRAIANLYKVKKPRPDNAAECVRDAALLAQYDCQNDNQQDNSEYQ